MADLVLSNGKEITFDFQAITRKDFLGFIDTAQADDESDLIFSKACGIEQAEILELPFNEYKRVMAAFFKKFNETVKLPDDYSPDVDLRLISTREYLNLHSSRISEVKKDEIIAKAYRWTFAELVALSLEDYQKRRTFFFDTCYAPLAETPIPNSPSVST